MGWNRWVGAAAAVAAFAAVSGYNASLIYFSKWGPAGSSPISPSMP